MKSDKNTKKDKIKENEYNITPSFHISPFHVPQWNKHKCTFILDFDINFYIYTT